MQVYYWKNHGNLGTPHFKTHPYPRSITQNQMIGPEPGFATLPQIASPLRHLLWSLPMPADDPIETVAKYFSILLGYSTAWRCNLFFRDT